GGAVPRLLVRAVLGGCAIPAHAEREPAPAPGAGRIARGADRRREGWDPDRGPRILLDRPAALQRAVRRAGLPRDQEREDRRDAQGRSLPDPYARVLERHGPDRRAEHVSAR